MKWEHLKAMDFLRNQNEPQRKGRSGASGSGQTRVVSRVSGGQGQGMGQVAGDLQKQVSDITEALNMELERKFKVRFIGRYCCCFIEITHFLIEH